MASPVKRVVFYIRVSTDDQKVRQTIQNQVEVLKRRLEATPGVELAGIYSDDGVSGIIPLANRPGGRRLMIVIDLGRIDEIWVVRADRLGRDASDTLRLWKVFEKLGVKLVGVEESMESYLLYGIQALFADDEREKFLKRSAAGMARAARNGRYTGGIVPLGYRVEGEKPDARLVVSDTIIWADWTEADLVRRIYEWLALDNRSCRRIADELNRLGVPTVYQRDGRGIRGRRTQGKWRAGRIRNLVVNPVYKGQLCYGRRTKKRREVITADCEAIVSEELWEAAQQALARNRIMAKNTNRIYMLRSKIVCGVCGLKFCGSWNRRSAWYRCNGRLTDRGPTEGRCPSKMVKGEYLDTLVWEDIERSLRNPGELLEELSDEANADGAPAVAEAERTTLQAALASLTDERELTLDLYTKRHITAEELDERMEGLQTQQSEVQRRLTALEPPPPAIDTMLPSDLREKLLSRLEEGLDDALKQEIASLLVSQIAVYPTNMDGRKSVRIVIEYRFAVSVSTGTGSSPPGA